MRMARIVFFSLLLLPFTVWAAEFKLAFPVDCSLGEDCIIQNYVDLDPGEGYHDYNCGALSYDGHKGTDIRIRDFQALAEGVAVLAAADGVVLGTRNDVDDRQAGESYEEYLAKISGKECGNGVVLVHEEGYQTQYCHLRRGSVAVTKGARISEGEVLGLIGMSGKTQFPHLHISVRRGKDVVGPFTGPCSSATSYLWKDQIGYTDTHLLKYGFADTPQTLVSIEEGNSAVVTATSQALLFWANVVGIREGDRQKIEIRKPDGSLLVTNSQTIAKSKVNWLSYVGKKRPPGRWPTGVYTAVYTLERDGIQILEAEAMARLE